MKGGLAAAIVAVETLLESGIDLPGALEISGTVDEESGGYGGVAWLAGQGFFSRPRVDHVIIPEPLNVDRVCIGHRGVWWAEIETHRPDRAWLDAVPGRLRGAPHGRRDRRLRARAVADPGAAPHGDAGGARRCPGVDLERELDPWRPVGRT